MNPLYKQEMEENVKADEPSEATRILQDQYPLWETSSISLVDC
jgi:hypothetical protein